MLRISQFRLSPPRSPRNSFFPWHNFILHRSGGYLPNNRLVLKVPVNLTKPEIRSYIQQIYGAKVLYVNTLIRIPRSARVHAGRWKGKYYRLGPIHKRAFLITEYPVPDEVRMMRSSRTFVRNPDLLKQNINYGIWPNGRLKRRQIPDKVGGWRHPIPKLLAPEDMDINPKLRIDETETRMAPDLAKPFLHSSSPFSPKRGKPEGLPDQQYMPVDLYPYRKRFAQLRALGVIHGRGSNVGISQAVPTHPMAHLAYGDRKPKVSPPTSTVTGKLRPTPSAWRQPY